MKRLVSESGFPYLRTTPRTSLAEILGTSADILGTAGWTDSIQPELNMAGLDDGQSSESLVGRAST